MTWRMRTSWREPAFRRRTLHPHLKAGVRDAVDHLIARTQDNISTQGYANVIMPPGVHGIPGRTIDHAHSRPWQFPYEQAGDLIASLRRERGPDSPFETMMACASPYGLALEFGRPEINLLPRPFLARTFWEERTALARLMLRPW